MSALGDTPLPRAGWVPACEWLALLRVDGGAVVKLAEGYLDHDLPIPGYLVGVLDELTSAGLFHLADGGGLLVLTEVGRARYAVLCQVQGLPAGVAVVPSSHQIAALASVIRQGHLTTGQRAGLARLVEQAGDAVRVTSRLAARDRDPLWEPVTVVFHELVGS